MPQVLDEMIVRITGDQTKYKKSMDDAVQTTKRGTQQIQDELDSQGKDADDEKKSPWKKQAKNIKAMGKAAGAGAMILGELTDENTKLGKSLAGLTTAATLATINPYIGIAMGLKSLVGLFKQSESAAHKALMTMVDGSKTATQALGDLHVEVLTDKLKGVIEESVRLSTQTNSMFGNFIRQSFDATHGVDAFANMMTQAFERDVTDAVASAADQIRLLSTLLLNPEVQRAMRLLEQARATRDLGAMQEELRLRRENIGLSEQEMNLRRLAARLPREGLPGMVASFWIQQLQATLQNVTAMERADQTVRRLSDSYRDLGLSAEEAAAQQAEAAGLPEQADKIRNLAASIDSWRQAQDNLNRAHQYSQQLYERTRTGEERIADEIENINRDFARGTQSVEVYTRAILQQQQALQQLQATQEQFDSVRFGSAAARARLEAQRSLFAAATLNPNSQRVIQQRLAQNAAVPAAGGATLVHVDFDDAEWEETWTNIGDLLADAVGYLRDMADRPQLEVEGAGF